MQKLEDIWTNLLGDVFQVGYLNGIKNTKNVLKVDTKSILAKFGFNNPTPYQIIMLENTLASKYALGFEGGIKRKNYI